MSAKTLYFIFSGTSNYWEDTAIFLDLPILLPDNISYGQILNEKSIHHSEAYYFCYDGVSSLSFQFEGDLWSTHITPTNIKFDPNSPRFMTPQKEIETTFFTPINQKAELILGKGMEENGYHALQIFEYLTIKLKQEIEKICFIGFSRGGVTAIVAANFISQIYPLIPMDMFLLDPVPGPGNFIAAKPCLLDSRLTFSTTTIPQNVKRCVFLLALEEIMRGFEPLDANTVKFTHSKTKFTFLPVPDDHSQAIMWGAGIIKDFFPSMIKDITGIEDISVIRDIRKKLLEMRSRNQGHGSNITRHQNFLAQKHEFDPNLKLQSNSAVGFQHIVDTYYQSGYMLDQARTTFVSLQNTISSRKTEQQILGKGNIRAVRKQHSLYAENKIFLNIHHQLCFCIAYPFLYKYMIGMDGTEDLTHQQIEPAINSINKGHVKNFFSQFNKDYTKLHRILGEGVIFATNIQFNKLSKFFYPESSVNLSDFPIFSGEKQKLMTLDMFLEMSSLISQKISLRNWSNHEAVITLMDNLTTLISRFHKLKNVSNREKTIALLKITKSSADDIDESNLISAPSKANTFLTVFKPLSQLAQKYGISDNEWMK